MASLKTTDWSEYTGRMKEKRAWLLAAHTGGHVARLLKFVGNV